MRWAICAPDSQSGEVGLYTPTCLAFYLRRTPLPDLSSPVTQTITCASSPPKGVLTPHRKRPLRSRPGSAGRGHSHRGASLIRLRSCDQCVKARLWSERNQNFRLGVHLLHEPPHSPASFRPYDSPQDAQKSTKDACWDVPTCVSSMTY